MTVKGRCKYPHDVLQAITAEWKAGTPTKAIARKVNLTKGVVIGLVHRMRLPERPSPIKRAPIVKRTDGGGCRWLSHGNQCGMPIERGSYCATHAAITYAPTKAVRRPAAATYKPRRDGI